MFINSLPSGGTIAASVRCIFCLSGIRPVFQPVFPGNLGFRDKIIGDQFAAIAFIDPDRLDSEFGISYDLFDIADLA